MVNDGRWAAGSLLALGGQMTAISPSASALSVYNIAIGANRCM
jgi:hypothetical protein